jgi:hypothetical protein
MFLILAGALFSVFVVNVFLGATTNSAFMGDVAEMLLLFCATLAFTAAILKREAQAKEKAQNQHQDT